MSIDCLSHCLHAGLGDLIHVQSQDVVLVVDVHGNGQQLIQASDCRAVGLEAVAPDNTQQVCVPTEHLA